MPDRAVFLTFRFAIQYLLAFFLSKKVSLNSIHIVGSNGRGRDQFYNISHVSGAKNQSSKFGNKCTDMCFHKHVDPLSFYRRSVAFYQYFPTIIFQVGCSYYQVKLGRVKLK